MIKAGQASIAASFAKIENGEVVLLGMNVPPYECGNRFNHVQDRPRRLLLHRNEIIRLVQLAEQKGCTLVPLSLYTKNGLIKVQLGVCRGKRMSDKRETLKKKTADMEAARAIAARFRK